MAEQQERDERWADVVSAWRASGLSQREFCLRRGISDRALNNWLYKSPYRERVAQILAARPQRDLPVEMPRFMPVSIVATTEDTEAKSRATPIEVVMPSGLRIAVTPGFDAETLRRVVATLEARPC